MKVDFKSNMGSEYEKMYNTVRTNLTFAVGGLMLGYILGYKSATKTILSSILKAKNIDTDVIEGIYKDITEENEP